ncbi:MAG: ABC transporter ATP-binding protein [Rickettsia endosymbiont of Bryobia graminum]|nr:ABC transporter ATP-binding protein [Rickettsia endosymbiont of Bryobia graminum]
MDYVMNEILKLQNISKQYKQGKAIIEVLNNVNLTVKQGELVAIIGASGSGKSTLLHIAGLLDVPDSGLVEIVSNKSSNKDLLRLHNIGFVYQQHHLLKDFTALENIAMPRLISGADYKLALEDARQLLSELGLEGKINNLPGELSGGEQQRVAVARAMINNPKVILADEPTGNLDPNTAEEVFNLFLKTASVKNTAMIIVTHNHEIAKRMHNVYELKNGILN